MIVFSCRSVKLLKIERKLQISLIHFLNNGPEFEIEMKILPHKSYTKHTLNNITCF